jgi:hypothetical protein
MNDVVIKSEAYTVEDVPSDIELTYRKAKSESASYVMQNNPNPFKDETIFQFSLQEKSPVDISIYDTNGSMVFKSNDIYNAGNHTLRLTEKQLGNKYGVFFCKIKTKNLDQIIKILRIE